MSAPERCLDLLNALPRPLAAVCAVFALISLSGYLTGHEYLYRPIPGGASTHPLTAISLLLISVATIISRWRRARIWRLTLSVSAIVFETTRLLDWILDTRMHEVFTPFQAVVTAEVAAKLNNGFGVNTAIALLGISIARLLTDLHHTKAAQLLVFTAMALPCITLVGYAYGLPHIYGQMSLLTASLTLTLAVTVFSDTLGDGWLRVLLHKRTRRIGALQIIAGFWIPILLGYLVFEAIAASAVESESFIGLYVVGSCWIFMLLAATASVFYQRLLAENQRLLSLMTQTAQTDQLTGIANRRRFLGFGEFEFERARRTGRPIWVIVIDVDFFKEINDTDGHDAGDQTLKAIALMLKKHSRSVDLVARVGGDEFVVVLTDTPREGALTWASQLQQRAATLEVPGYSRRGVSLSIGAACSTGKTSLENTLQTADRYLYVAKDAGRNRAEFEPDLETVGSIKAIA